MLALPEHRSVSVGLKGWRQAPSALLLLPLSSLFFLLSSLPHPRRLTQLSQLGRLISGSCVSAAAAQKMVKSI